jgi:NAD(P)-dependent dehydrogenase (short-subunit alcohol dehydrogenase family)
VIINMRKLETGEGEKRKLIASLDCTIPALDVPVDEARLCFETNFFSIITITQAFTPLLLAFPGDSLIINIGSVAVRMIQRS